MQIVILPSLDYELFHGRNFVSEDETLFAPTTRILDGCTQRGIPMTLFADVLCVEAYRAAGREDFCRRFEAQLVNALEKGHDVQLHIHAHWGSSKYVAGEWQLTEPKITLSDYGFDTEDPARMIDGGVTYLRSLLGRVDENYRCLAFRAGALAMQPHERSLLRLLELAGIQVDSSLAKGLHLEMDTVSIDYRKLPREANWWISSRGGLDGGGSAGIFEIPIAAFHSTPAERLSFVLRRMAAFRERRGSGISRANRQTRLANLRSLLLANLRYLASDPVFLFSADTKGFTRSMLVRGFTRYVAEHEGRGASTIYASMINHPKLMFPKQEQMFFETLEELQQRYGSRLRFATYRDVCDDFQQKEALTA